MPHSRVRNPVLYVRMPSPKSDSKQNHSELSNDEIIAALTSGDCAAVLRGYFGAPEYEELRVLARRAHKARVARAPRVYLLPGIMGSMLGIRRGSQVHTIWLNPDAIESGELFSLALPDEQPIRPIGVMLAGYLKLKLMLTIAGFDVVFHPFDWRKSVIASGRDLVQRIVREKHKSVAIVGHSMG